MQHGDWLSLSPVRKPSVQYAVSAVRISQYLAETSTEVAHS